MCRWHTLSADRAEGETATERLTASQRDSGGDIPAVFIRESERVNMAEMTPMMKQYWKVKENHPDCLLFFRLGDFYEMFHDDAKLGAEELGLTLTTRDRGKPEEERTPMCGVPYHSAQSYIARLIKRGYKVAICEQMEDPATAKGLVDRDVIRIVTPGTAMDDVMLDESRNNFICAIYLDSAGAGLSQCDLSTGQFSAAPFHGEGWLSHLLNRLSAQPPSEAILSDGAFAEKELTDFLQNRLGCLCENGGEARFRPAQAKAALVSCGVWPEGEELPEGPDGNLLPGWQAAGALAAYLKETQKTDLSHLSRLELDGATRQRYLELDLTARRTLELTETIRGGEKKGSLLWVLDKTKTPMGHRLIRAWIEQPLCDPAAVSIRQDQVAALAADAVVREELARTLRQVPDLERIISKVVYGSANARDMLMLADGLAVLPVLAEQAAGLVKAAPRRFEFLDQFTGLGDLQSLLKQAIRDDEDDNRLPFTIREGGFIRKGYDEEVDHLRDVIDHGADMVAALEGREKERTGIKSLKVRYNKVFGYYIEVSKSNYSLVPGDYIRKQTLVNCERFITQELKDLEHEILSAQSRVTALEYQLFCRLRDTASQRVHQVQDVAGGVGYLDVLCSFAAVAMENGYVRPAVDNSGVIDIKEGRHPVVERMLKDSLFVPNDVHMDGGENRLAIITGPNMAGKSTYMRQVALIVLMAQMGSFVPARTARIGVVDRVFTRIGASDDLSAGQSTFMVEMTEVAAMLKNATSRSLLILDEIGRGTSTYDGMSIARAVLEHCADKGRLGAKTLFATHYHELTEVEHAIEGVRNYQIAAKKRGDGIVFLRKIVPGGADQSYGVEVAKLAGVPNRVVDRAREILGELERQGWVPSRAQAPREEPDQVSLGDMAGAAVLEQLQSVSVETLTPIEAMNLLYQLKNQL